MKNQVLDGYRVFKKIQVRVESGSDPRKTLPENTCITSQVIHRHKGWEYVSTKTPTEFLKRRVSNQSILSLRLASTTAPVLLGRIQVLVPALVHILA